MAAPPRPGPSRRRFLRGATLLAALSPVGPAVLEACSFRRQQDSPRTLPIAAPGHPVTWEIPADNPAIRNGLAPERGATLRVFTYNDYIAPEAVRSFEDGYGVTVEIATFNSTDAALTKLRDGAAQYDVYSPGYDQIGRLVTGGLLRPLNHTYLPNIANIWPVFTDPWYDREWRYSVPYTVYTTGLAWRTDQIPDDVAALHNPYDSLWDRAFRGKTAIIDDWHTAMAMVLLRLGITDVNTSSAEDLQRVAEALAEMAHNTAPEVGLTMVGDLPAGAVGLAQMWSGDIVSAARFLPEGVSPAVLRYWFPADGAGLVDNDLLVVLRGGKNPVLAHLFLNHLLDPGVAAVNFAATGYQPPQVSLDPVRTGVVPRNLAAAVVKPEFFDVGYRILELTPDNQAAWQEVWRSFKTRRP